jgi:hypothetical protein
VSDWDDEEPPEDLTGWLRAGYRRAEARRWRRWRFELEQAQAWQAAGVAEALSAAQWRTAGVTPSTVDRWRSAGIGPTEAVRWHEFGVDLASAVRLTAEGKPPGSVEMLEEIGSRTYRPLSDAERAHQERLGRFLASIGGTSYDVRVSYQSADWLDDEAAAWARSGIRADPARLWRALGLRPAEAAALAAEPAAVIAEWWRAGIPFDELADWLGAGLTAAEAAAQRAAGITVQQAAALRALRATDDR